MDGLDAWEVALIIWLAYCLIWILTTVSYFIWFDTIPSLTWNWLIFSLPALPPVIFMGMIVVPMVLIFNWAWKTLNVPVFKEK